ncbi:MAG TPA: type III-B CRISPR module RAMP protein Cmr4 [Thermoanaerobaculia bacterium]|nr:type III-B CRISPR module RAMP protein Cmr4 [Thermoanaerobaculia bacterium]
MTARLTLVHAMSPLHAGTGQSVGAIDLPVARERPTGIPLVPASSIKGALRARSRDPQLTRDIFGPETTSASDHAGSVQFSDVHVVLFPVRSVAGTYAWVTSRYLLQRFARTAREAGLSLPPLPQGPAATNTCTLVNDTLTINAQSRQKVVLEDLDFAPTVEAAEPPGPLAAFATAIGKALFPQGSSNFEEWRTALLSRICMVHDDVMSFLLDNATEVSARIRLNEDTKTVEKGALWYQEALPSETILAGLVIAADVKAVNGRSDRKADELLKAVSDLTKGLVQLGGKSTIGHGSCLVQIAGGQP